MALVGTVIPGSRSDGSTVDAINKAIIHNERAKGKSIREITNSVPYAYNTVRAVLVNQIPDQDLVNAINKREIAELDILGGLARTNLIKRFTQSNPNVIESTAVMDKTFQQRRLMRDLSTENVSVAADVSKKLADIEAKISDWDD